MCQDWMFLIRLLYYSSLMRLLRIFIEINGNYKQIQDIQNEGRDMLHWHENNGKM